jgi:hypothetical protein
MQEFDGFIVRFENAVGKVFRAYIPPTRWPTGAERREAATLERRTRTVIVVKPCE